jgi:hypothetical protein
MACSKKKKRMLAMVLCSCAGASVAFLSNVGPAAQACQPLHARAPQNAPRHCSCAVPPARFSLRLSASEGAAAPQEPQGWNEEMEGLILALSKQEDGPRRQRVAEMFGQALAGVGVGDQPPEFATNFQIALDKVGGEVQELARKKVLEQQVQGLAASEEPAPEESSAEEFKKFVPRVKTAEELQVWALIDMMVQSKLLVSRATRADSK